MGRRVDDHPRLPRPLWASGVQSQTCEPGPCEGQPMSPTQACLGAEAPHRDVPAADVCDLLNSPMKVATHFPTSESTKWPLSLGRAPQPPSSPFGPQHLLLALAPWKLLELLTVPFSHTLRCTHQQILGLNCNILLEPLINYVRGFLQGPKHLGSKVLPPESPCGSPTLSHLPKLCPPPSSQKDPQEK